jgi:hypothetical protein
LRQLVADWAGNRGLVLVVNLVLGAGQKFIATVRSWISTGTCTADEDQNIGAVTSRCRLR